jgi:hypothetical protein
MKWLKVLQLIGIITCLLLVQAGQANSSVPLAPVVQSNLDPSFLSYEETPPIRLAKVMQQSSGQVLVWGFNSSMWATFAQILGEEGLAVTHSSTRPIVPSTSYAAIVIEEPDSPLTVSEKENLRSYVTSGGKLIVGADTHTANVNPLLQEYGVTLIESLTSGSGFVFAAGNPLFSGVSMLSTKPDYEWDGYIASVSSPSAAIAWLDSTPIIAETSDSRVLTIAEDEVFLDGWGVENANNQTFIRNLAQWIGSRTEVTVKVVNEQGNPIQGAKVYLNGALDGTTGSDGLMNVWVQAGDELVATSLVLEQTTSKGSHSQDSSQNWAYRVHLTSADVSDDGTINTHVVVSTNVTQTLTIKKSNTLIGFNIVASVEWDATGSYLDELEQGFEEASEYLYDASDGQMYFELATIYDDNANWNNADFQFKASNQEWPHTNNIGGILDGSDKRAYFGRHFSGSSANQGSWTNSNGFRTFIHEFGHYALYLYDEYFYYGGFLGLSKIDTQCTANRTNWGSPYSNASVASSLMDYQFSTTEFCSTLTANPHNHDTYQHQKNGESTWETIVRKYSDSQATPRWEFQTPVSHGQVVAGPNSIPASGWMQTEVNDNNTGTCVGTLEYHIENIWGNPAKGVDVWLKRSGGRTIYQGKTDDHGDIVVLGAANGDTLTAKSKFNLYINSTTISCSSSYASVQATGTTAATIVLESAPFTVDVFTVPGMSGNTLEVRVQASTELIASPQVFLVQSGASSPTTLSMSYDSGTGTYTGTATLNPSFGDGGIVEVAAVDTSSQSVQVFANFKMETVSASEDMTILSGDGDAELYLPAGSLSQDTAISIFPSTISDWPDNEELVVVGGPYEIAATEGVALNQPGALTLRYHDDVNEARNVDLDTLKIYRWNTGTSQWVEVGGDLDAKHHEVSMPIDSLSIYALIGERQFSIYLPLMLRSD